jgi:hypothetical protein
MNEHDAPTVARATVWLDTSNETKTRPSELSDELATTRVRMRASSQPSEHETVVLERAPAPPDTAWDRSSVFAAFEQCTTESFARAVPTRSESVHLPMARPSPRAVAGSLSLAVVALAFWVGQLSAPETKPTVAPRLDPADPAPQSAPAAMPDAGAAEPSKPATEGAADHAAPVAGSTKAAVDALARGDYPRALALYEALAAHRPHDAALALIAALLSSRAKAHCLGSTQAEGPCGG